MDAPVSRPSSPLLTNEGHTVELSGAARLKKRVFLGGFWTCQKVLLGVVGMKEEEVEEEEDEGSTFRRVQDMGIWKRCKLLL